MTAWGILLTNTGTPDYPTPRAVRRYLREFLSDKRIIKLPRLLWLPFLYSFIVPLRPFYAAKLYQHIWTEAGSPMRIYMQQLASQLSQQLQLPVEVGMHYGQPSIQQGLNALRQRKVKRIMTVPLFPQYSNSTSATTYDKVFAALQKWPHLPELHILREYATQPAYIHALAEQVKRYWREHGKGEHLLISFHGIPNRYVKAGDPYPDYCAATAEQLAQTLQLPRDQWSLCFQSRFGYNRWLTPATTDLLQALPAQGIKNVDIICPGFAVDCLETLEEIVLRGEKTFAEAGGQSLHYIPALNASPAHVKMLAQLIEKTLLTEHALS